ncbi:MAG: lysylphosphatidylglycerol synthase domain-containing protein, partial [bacterium]
MQTAPASIFAGTVHRVYGSIFKSRLLFFSKVAVAILTLFILVKSIQLSTLIAVLKTSNMNYLVMALIFIVPNVWIQVLKWHFLLKLAKPDISLTIAYKSFIIGYPLGFVTPGRLGEFGRAFYVKEINQMKTFKLVIIDKSTNLLITLLFGVAGFLILSQNDLLPKIRFVLFSILGII